MRPTTAVFGSGPCFTLGTVCVVAAPLAVALGVGWGISKLWSGIWD